MVFEVPAAKRSLDQNLFKFKMPDDGRTVYKLPKLQYVKPSLFERLEGSRKIEIIRALTDEYIPGLFDKFEDPDQLLALYNAWAEDSGISVGESSGSTSSSEPTVEPSAEISSPSADPSTT